MDYEEKSIIKMTSLNGFSRGGNLVRVNVKGGRIIRIRPLHYDWKYKPDELPGFEFEARDKTFRTPMKELPPPFSLTYKNRIYSSNRVRYPLKRIDFDPNGDRRPEKRGKSGYVRISWEEAIGIVVNEIKRIIEKYGSTYAILAQSEGHGQTKTLHGGAHGVIPRLFSLLGGCTIQTRNPDSWEGWWWGAKHVWGGHEGLADPANIIFDVLENAEVLLCWGCDYEATPWGFQDQWFSQWGFWFSQLGIKQIFICPDSNYASVVHADKWIPIRPNTDAALHLAIAYVWITEENYDKEYVDTHTVGFDKFKDYVLGKDDGVPKTPKWAEEITGVPARVIKALARLWANRRTSIMHFLGGPMIRGPYATEPGRLEALLLAMQGLGKPGRYQLSLLGTMWRMPPRDFMERLLKLRAVRDWNVYISTFNHQEWDKLLRQFIPKTLVPEAILNPPISWYSHVFLYCAPPECQFVKYKYPADGLPEVHMIWSDTPCWSTCWNGGYKWIEAIRSEKIEFFVVQHPWLENDCLFADLILPVTTPFEEDDILMSWGANSLRSFALIYSPRCVEPVGESKSDYEICCLIAEKLGPALGMPDLLDKFTEGKKSIEDQIRWFFEELGASKYLSFEEFKEKGYWFLPVDPGCVKIKSQQIMFCEFPDWCPLNTPSGKIEFFSERLAENFPDDGERPAVPHYISYGESWQESLQHPRAKKYPFLLVSNHGRWRMHAQLDDAVWLREIPTNKIKGVDGYLYEHVWINPVDAERLGVKTGDVVRVYNDRGAVLGGAYVTDRIMPRVVSMDHGARVDLIAEKLDRGGAINLIAPTKTGKNKALMVVSGYLVGIEKVNLSELLEKNPSATNKPYNYAAGLCYESHVRWEK